MKEIDAYEIIEYMGRTPTRVLWDAVSLSVALGGDKRQYPASQGIPYRRTLRALKYLHERRVIGIYTTTMNENVYFERRRIK